MPVELRNELWIEVPSELSIELPSPKWSAGLGCELRSEPMRECGDDACWNGCGLPGIKLRRNRM